MSTDFHGQYCHATDKMMLTRSQAVAMCKRLKGTRPYHCKECDSWHMTTSRQDGGKNHRMKSSSPRR